jgi:hypothetical protein
MRFSVQCGVMGGGWGMGWFKKGGVRGGVWGGGGSIRNGVERRERWQEMSSMLSKIISRLVNGDLLLDGCVHRGNNTAQYPGGFLPGSILCNSF